MQPEFWESLDASTNQDANETTPLPGENVEQIHNMPLPETEIAVVGGGIAGCYTAWRLTKEGRKVTLFETRDELGGRIRSIQLPGIPCPAELGPMRYSSKHLRVVGLINKLGLGQNECTDHFKAPTNFYLRAKMISGSKEQRLLPWRRRSSRGFRWDRVYTGLEPDLQKLCKRYRNTPKDVPDAFVAYAIAKCLLQVYLSKDYKDRNPDHAGDIERVLRSLKKETPVDEIARLGVELGNIKENNEGENAWDVIKRYGVIGVDEPKPLDVKLNETGFWNVLQHYLRNEGFLLVHDAGGYESVYGNWNAAEAFKWYVDDFQKQDFLMPKRGFTTVIDKLYEILHNSGCGIRTSHRLRHIHYLPDNEYPWELEFEVTSEVGQVGPKSTRAKQIILALPQKAVEGLKLHDPDHKLREPRYDELQDTDSLNPTSGVWQRLKKHYLSGVRRQKLFKIFLLYHHPWWSDGTIHGKNKVLDSDTGRVFTDLPIRQVYYFGPTWIKDHIPTGETITDEFNKWGMIMASYSDAHYVNFWRPFAKVKSKRYLGSDDGDEACKKVWQLLDLKVRDDLEKLAEGPYVASERMVDKVLGQLDELHGFGQGFCPRPLIAIYMDWGQQKDLKAGWHTWEINKETWKIAKGIIRPFPDENFYICGEAFSHYQGWIEGALETADIVLKQGFGLDELSSQVPTEAPITAYKI